MDVPALERFAKARTAAGIAPVAIHTSYLINLASDDPKTAGGSLKLLKNDLDADSAEGERARAAVAKEILATKTREFDTLGVVLGSYGISSVFLLFGLVPLIGATVVAIFGPETKGRILEEISP